MKRIQMLAKATAALVVLAALIAGVPIVLAHAVGWPLPGSVPDVVAMWDAIVLANVPAKVVANTLACLVWIAWAQVALSAAIETVARVRGRVPRPARGLASPIQVGIGKLVATAALIVVVLPRSGAPLVSAASPLPRPIPVMAAAPGASGEPANAHSSSTSFTTVTMALVSGDVPPVERTPTWTVARGDNLWDIAEVTLGSGMRWSEIFELNRATIQNDGRSLTDPGVIEKGWVLTLPADADMATVDDPTVGDAPLVPTSPALDLPSVYTVTPGDSLWGIASAELGDGHRYSELFERNRGVRQEDGGALIDPGLIKPGWQLALPEAGAVPVDAHAGAPVHPSPQVVPSDPSPPLPVVPDENAEDAPGPPASIPSLGESATPPSPALEPSDAPPPVPVAPSAPDAPSPEPDWSVPSEPGADLAPVSHDTVVDPPVIPPVAAAADDRTPPVTAPADSGMSASGLSTGGHVASVEPPSWVAAIDPLGVAGGVLAVGSWAAYIRHRRRRSIRRIPGAATAMPSENVAEVLAALRDTALAGPAQSVATVLRTLSHSGRSRRGQRAVQPVAVFVTDETVSVQLAEACGHPLAGWTVSADENRWDHPRRHRLPDLDAPSPLPALVTIGGSTTQPVLVDLEAAGVISITGDDEAVAGLVRSMLVELAETPFADSLRVLAHGFGAALIDGHTNIEPVTDLTAVLDDLRSTITDYGVALARAGFGSCFGARVAGVTGDGLPPTILFTTETSDEVADTARVVPNGSGVVVVVIGEITAPALEISVADGHVEVPELGIRCPAQQLGADVARRIGEALADAAADADEPSGEVIAIDALRDLRPGLVHALPLPADEAIDLRDGEAERPAPYEDAPYEVCIRLLGDIDITGARAVPTAQQMAILGYLVTHRGADSVALQEALWRDSQPGKARLHNMMYELRRSLGAEVLPATADNTNPLGPSVVSDLELFDARVSAARHHPAEIAVDTLCGALDMVRGGPFTFGGRSARYYTWVDVENLMSLWEHNVVDVAHDMSTWFRSDGNGGSAAWAARQGLLASPLNETLVCDLMLSLNEAGDSRAAQTVFDEHERALEALNLGQAGEQVIEVSEQVRRSRPADRPTRAAASEC